MSPLNEDSQETTEAGEKDRRKKLDFTTAEQSTEKTSSGNKAQAAPYICGQCGKSFATEVKICQHIRIYSKKSVCQFCKKSFRDKQQLKDHVKMHMGEKPFICHLCGQSCSKGAHLKDHLRVHTGDKPFTCPQCGKRFNKKTKHEGPHETPH